MTLSCFPLTMYSSSGARLQRPDPESDILNPREKTCIEKCREWAELFLFLLVFYSFLLATWLGSISVLFQVTSVFTPRLKGTDSYLKNNPGIGFRPQFNTKTTLIYFRNHKDDKFTKQHFDSIERALYPYYEAEYDNFKTFWKQCRIDKKADDLPCAVNYTRLTEKCNRDSWYGYLEGKPCVLLRLNKVINWIPNIYTEKNVSESGMPDHLQYLVKEWHRSPRNPPLVWLDCNGEQEEDKDIIGRKIEYYPQQGFPFYYFPYQNQWRYLSPPIFIRFSELKPFSAALLQCRIWAKGVNVDPATSQGMVHFELLYDQI